MRRISWLLAASLMLILAACGTPTPSASSVVTPEAYGGETASGTESAAAPPEQATLDIVPEPTSQAGATERKQYSAPPAMAIDPNKTYTAIIETTDGKMTAELYAKDTPLTVNNFVALARDNFYDGVVFHRIIKDFMVQTGDPLGTGTGGPGYEFKDEPVTREYTKGTLAMANSGPNTNGSQFFIVHQDYPLPKNYTIFGKVTDGMDTLDKIANTPVEADPNTGEMSKPTQEVRITHIAIEEK